MIFSTYILFFFFLLCLEKDNILGNLVHLLSKIKLCCVFRRFLTFTLFELGSLSNPDSFKHIDDTKEKHIQGLNSAHSKLYAEIDKIHNWTASIESECKQKVIIF